MLDRFSGQEGGVVGSQPGVMQFTRSFAPLAHVVQVWW